MSKLYNLNKRIWVSNEIINELEEYELEKESMSCLREYEFGWELSGNSSMIEVGVGIGVGWVGLGEWG